MLISGHNAVGSGISWFRILHTKSNEVVVCFFQSTIIVRNVTYPFQENHCNIEIRRIDVKIYGEN